MANDREWYKKWWGVIAAIVILPLFAIWYVWAKTNWSNPLKIVLTVLIGFLAVVFVALCSSSTETDLAATQSTATATPNSATTAQTETQPTQEPALSYEILSANKTNQLMRVEVYTTEKNDDRIIKINDKLVEQYKSGVTNLYIDYFDDKVAAQDYFTKQADDSISEQKKDELYSHYIANMVYNTNTGLKKLTRQGDNQTTLKTY